MGEVGAEKNAYAMLKNTTNQKSEITKNNNVNQIEVIGDSSRSYGE